MALNKKKSSGYSQRRAVKRCAMVAAAEVTDMDSNTRLLARVSEIGTGGCYVDSMNSFPVGTLVNVRISRDRGAFEAQAKVVYSDPTMGMGMAFTEVAPAQRLTLEDWLAEIVKPAS